MCTSEMCRSGPRIMALLKYLKRIEPSKEGRIQSVLPKPDCPLVRLMPSASSAIETANIAASAVYMKRNKAR